MSFLGDLVVRLKAETADFVQGMDQASRSGTKAMAQLESAAAKLGVAVSAGALVAFVKHSIDANDRLHDLAISTHVSAVELGGLGFVASQSGSDLDSVAKSFGRMNNAIAEALSGNKEMGKVFGNMGITLEDLKKQSPEQIFLRLSDVFKGTAEDANAAGYAQKVFGKNYMALMPMFEEGADKIRKQIDYYKQYSGVTEDLTRKADEFNDELVKLKLLSAASGNQIAVSLLPSLKLITEELVKMKQESDGVSAPLMGFVEVMKVVAVMAINTGFAITTLGKEIARFIENAKLIVTGDWAGSRRLGQMFAEDAAKARKEVDDLSRKIMAFKILTSKDIARFPATAEDVQPGAYGTGKGTKLPPLPRSESHLEAIAKREAAAVQEMENKRKSLFGTTEEMLMAERILGAEITLQDGRTVKLKATYGEFDPVVKAWLQNAAKEIDARKQLIDRIDVQAANTALYRAGLEAANDAQTSFFTGQQANIRGVEFETSMIGKLAHEQTRAQAMRQQELAIKEMLSAIDPELYPKEAEAAQALAEVLRGNLNKALDEQLVKQRDVGVAVTGAMEKYANDAKYNAEAVASAFTNAFKSMEDALVEFSMSGKLNFKNFADSVLRDILRIQIKQNITGPLAEAMKPGGSFDISKFFGGIFGSSTPGGATGAMTTGEYGAAVTGLPGYATGTDFVPRDMLAYVHKGEAIIPANENRGGGQVVVNITTPDIGSFRASRAQIAADLSAAMMVANRRGG